MKATMNNEKEVIIEENEVKAAAEEIAKENIEAKVETETGTDTEKVEADTETKKEEAEAKKSETDISQKAEEESDANYLRLMADFQNYKKRVEKEKSDIHAYANEKIINKLLNVMDNFERALVHAPQEASKFHEGMEMILTQLKEVIAEAGAEEIAALGNPFDPNFHNAVMMEDVEDEKKDTVIDVLQKGYTLKGKVIRPSMVRVGK